MMIETSTKTQCAARTRRLLVSTAALTSVCLSLIWANTASAGEQWIADGTELAAVTGTAASRGNLKLVWQDDFNDMSQWSDCEPWQCGGNGHLGYGEVANIPGSGNATVQDGKLVLKVTECSNPLGKSMCGAEVTTRGTMDDFTYGRLEVRAKFDNAAGLWPGIWAMGPGQWPHESGEIDLMEVVNNGKDNRKPYFSLHWGGCGGKCQLSDLNPPTLTNDYHTYVLERTPDRVRQIIDGQVYTEVTRAEAVAHGGDPSPIFDAPMHIRLSNGSGGVWAGPVQQPGEFVIDSVRVYE